MRCNLCGKKLKNSDSLISHIKSEHSGLSEKSIMYLINEVGVSREKLINVLREVGYAKNNK